ncbi:MAG TPA: transposase, partial [Vicinamibacterales bacterium]|nr:transposase [Vicinamibacterales bacterium]
MLAGISSASIQGRIALGPRAGRRVWQVGEEPDAPWVLSSHPRPAHIAGFDLHANVAVPAPDRRRLEQLCRYLLRPPVAQERLRRMGDDRILLTCRALLQNAGVGGKQGGRYNSKRRRLHANPLFARFGAHVALRPVYILSVEDAMSVAKYLFGGLTVVAVSLSLVIAPAQAVPVVVFQDTFDSNAAGLNSTPSGWTVSDGTVDIIASGSFGISCAGGSGVCIDMDGSTGDAGVMTTNSVFTNSGAASFWTLEFDVSGNQRTSGSDSMAVTFDGVTNVVGPLAGNAP